MLKQWIACLFRYVCVRRRRRYCCYVLCLVALFSLPLFGVLDVSSYFAKANEDIIMTDKESKMNNIPKEHNQKVSDNNTQEADPTKTENAFAKQMIMGIIKRQYSHRYEFNNISEKIYTTLHDITHTCAEGEPPIQNYSKWFRNFCWFQNDCGCHEKPSMVRCFPGFHLIGFPKAGTTDFYQRLMMHPQILETQKETNYWSVVRFIDLGNETERLRGHDTRAYFTEKHITKLENATVIHKGVQQYLDFYLKPLRHIESDFGYTPESRKFSEKMFGEGSVTYAYSSLGLRISIGSKQNKSPMDVDCNIAKIIRWLTPEAKIIVSLRDPVERLYSDYRNLFNGLKAHEKNASDFHERVVNRIGMWKECMVIHYEDYCINSPQFEAVNVHSAIIGLVRSMYILHLRKWLKEFPRDQVFILHFEERLSDGERVMSEVVDYLGLDPFTPEKLDAAINANLSISKENERRLPHQAGNNPGPMWEKTRKILQDFYRPYNQRLAKLLMDEKYLWYDSKQQFSRPSSKLGRQNYESLK